jgi:hypothetical protein
MSPTLYANQYQKIKTEKKELKNRENCKEFHLYQKE